jgi:hypothetical protein
MLRRLLALATTVVAVGFSPGAAMAGTASPVDWRSYVQAPRSERVRPVAATVLSGQVTNPRGLTAPDAGRTTLMVTRGGTPATVLLDYGREVVGTPYLDPGRATGAALRLTFSETRRHLYTPGSSTLTADAAAGATAVTVADAATFAVGDRVTIGDRADTITAIAGSTLRLAHRLGVPATAGTAVTSEPGALTGDVVGVAGYSRPQSIPLTGRARLSGSFEGGLRYETITLSTPGTVVLHGAGIDFAAYRATPAQYQGHFVSSSDALNRMWFDGAYTEQTDMTPAGVQGAKQPSVLDGAKRDRKIWSGDMAVEDAGILASLGSGGAPYVKQSLEALLALSTPGSGLAGYANPAGGSDGHDPAYSNTYSSWTLDDVTQYYRATGDTAFARHALPYLEGQLSYDATLTDGAGLLVTAGVFGGAGSGLDWDIYDGPKAGVVTSANLLYYRALTDVAYVESHLGDSGKAATYQATANRLRDAINTELFSTATGAYDFSDSGGGVIAQDANSLAILFGVAPHHDIPGIIRALESLWGPHGSAPFSANAGKSPTISPFVTGLEVQALYRAGYATDAEKLLALTWNQMTDPRNPGYTGTFWENYLPDGTLADGSISASHGWSSGPTPTLTGYVLGVQAVEPGYRGFTVAPHFGTLNWAEGTVPTPYGRIGVTWTRHGTGYTLTVQAPPGTTATIEVGGGRTVTVHGGARTVTAVA